MDLKKIHFLTSSSFSFLELRYLNIITWTTSSKIMQFHALYIFVIVLLCSHDQCSSKVLSLTLYYHYSILLLQWHGEIEWKVEFLLGLPNFLLPNFKFYYFPKERIASQMMQEEDRSHENAIFSIFYVVLGAKVLFFLLLQVVFGCKDLPFSFFAMTRLYKINLCWVKMLHQLINPCYIYEDFWTYCLKLKLGNHSG